MIIVGLAGRLHSGKDTAASLLVERLGFARMAFADLVKDFTAGMLGVPREWCDDPQKKSEVIGTLFNSLFPGVPPTRDVTLRWFLQRVGTEGGRKIIGEGFWIRLLFERAERMGVERLVIPDVCFLNEAHAILGRRDYGDRSYLFRCNRADMKYEHDFLGTVVDGKCRHLDRAGNEWCTLPPKSHPTAWSEDRHPSETELPVRGHLYDMVAQTGSAEATAHMVLCAVTVIVAAERA